ncbi:hypothetical protein DYB26_005115 [Aphanomyces astaci]|uniref:Uncharacterized protein n=1 Tax=Aphanomyces astaci TaxID=112090 RepID=A0A3R6ZBP6_APHAT|nr:hypothetical protein DYB26_005115 [Aphanomyces astaci]
MGQFAFANVSMESVVLQNGTVAQVESGAFATFRDTIGPFGSVDVKHVAVPPSVVRFVLHVKDTMTLLRTKSLSLSAEYSALYDPSEFCYIPASWFESGQVYGAGGNIMCPESTTWVLEGGLWVLTAVIALNMVVPSVNTTHEGTALCPNVVGVSVDVCQALMLDRPLSFLKNSSYFGDNEVWFSTMAALAATAQADVRNVAVEVFHTARSTQREVISLQGDRGTINLLSTNSPDVDSLVNPLEVPVNVASYIRYACLYVTSAIICVAFLSTLYLLVNRGYVEGLNMLELNRVAGVVWVGRTLLFVRGLAAISLLSTQVLTLTPVGYQWGISDPRVMVDETAIDQSMRFFKTFLAAGEVSWLGFVLSDMLIVVTHQYTTAYMFKCHFMVWAVYYIDPASAVINGMLSIQVKNTFYIFDVKVWRLFVIDEPNLKRKRLHDEGAVHLLQAIPLTD